LTDENNVAKFEYDQTRQLTDYRLDSDLVVMVAIQVVVVNVVVGATGGISAQRLLIPKGVAFSMCRKVPRESVNLLPLGYCAGVSPATL
jgi:hypothetical protein